jgi:methyl-accepting chemotaxis protein-1 (serine sensor receptor)
MNQLKVSTRLTLLIALMSLLLLAVGGLGLWSTAQSNAALKTVYEDRTVPASQLGEVKALLLMDRLALAAAVMEPTPEVLKERVAQLEANRARLDKVWKAYTATTLTPDEAAHVKTFDRELVELDRDGLVPALAALKAGDLKTVERLAVGPLKAMFVKAEPTLEALDKIQIDEAQKEYTAAVARYALVRNASIAVSAFGLLLGACLGVWMIRSLTRELGAEPRDAAALAQSVAAGDLSVAITLRDSDSSSLMAQTKAMRDSLARVVSHVRENAEGVATASSQIAQGNSDLSGRTEEQAAALQQTAASMEQLNTTVAQNAESARQAQQLAQGASSVAMQGGEVVQDVVLTMKDIDASSKRIADIIGVIDGIAFQTNILALNAAVEAARAGDQGRGFAVVAGEVRTLAQRSAEAAKEIKSLITASVEGVQKGSALVDRAGQTMNEVVTSIRRVSDIVSEISAASAEQSAGVQQVGRAMTQMDQATQQNSALVEESAAAADSLKQQAQQLLLSVAVFSLRGGQARAVDAARTPVPAPAPAFVAAAAVRFAGSARPLSPAKAGKPAGKPAAARATVTADNEEWESF